ncbi:MAG: nucleotidyltransferase family protein [Anaerolineales bacterium]|nr:nucleotidyltransferase family protein [Anaerolineales bacterium]
MRWDEIDWERVDWSWVRDVGRRERLLPLWYAMLRRQNRLHVIPADLRQVMQRAYYAALATNTLALEEAARLWARCAAQGIDAVALKGVALLATIYQDRGVRPLGDIDLWVRAQDGAEAQAVLRAAGYHGLPHQDTRGPQRFLAERTFMRNTAPAMQVDLHTGPWARPALHSAPLTTWLWSHTQIVATESGPLRVFDASAQLVHLCLHATQHDEGRLRPLRLHDLAVILAEAPLEWAEVTAIGQAARVTPALEQALDATLDAWGVAAPVEMSWPIASRRARLRCALLASEQRAVRWLVDGCALHDPRAMVALWCAVLWPAREYRAWRAVIRKRAKVDA